jgi:hypothetical protein
VGVKAPDLRFVVCSAEEFVDYFGLRFGVFGGRMRTAECFGKDTEFVVEGGIDGAEFISQEGVWIIDLKTSRAEDFDSICSEFNRKFWVLHCPVPACYLKVLYGNYQYGKRHVLAAYSRSVLASPEYSFMILGKCEARHISYNARYGRCHGPNVGATVRQVRRGNTLMSAK